MWGCSVSPLTSFSHRGLHLSFIYEVRLRQHVRSHWSWQVLIGAAVCITAVADSQPSWQSALVPVCHRDAAVSAKSSISCSKPLRDDTIIATTVAWAVRPTAVAPGCQTLCLIGNVDSQVGGLAP